MPDWGGGRYGRFPSIRLSVFQSDDTEVNSIDVTRNSRLLECHSSWFAHFDSDSLNRRHPDVEKGLRYGLQRPQPARFWRSPAGFGT